MYLPSTYTSLLMNAHLCPNGYFSALSNIKMKPQPPCNLSYHRRHPSNSTFPLSCQSSFPQSISIRITNLNPPPMASPRFPSLMVCFTATLAVSIVICRSEAREFLVGDSDDAWRVPPTTTDSLNQWAEKNRFQVGDSLVWKYDGAKDSVLQVTRAAYLSCNRSNPIAEHRDGATVVQLRRSGPYYFISGAAGACEEGQKLIVVVLSERHSLRRFSPAPSPTENQGPAAAPASGSTSRVTAGAVMWTGMAAALLLLGTLLL